MEIKYKNTPLEYANCLEEFKTTDQGLCVLYFYILKEKKHILKDIFNSIAISEYGAILFHCTLGRDRKGIVSMLLLGLVGVSK